MGGSSIIDKLKNKPEKNTVVTALKYAEQGDLIKTLEILRAIVRKNRARGKKNWQNINRDGK